MIRLADTPAPHVTQVAQSVLGLFRSKGVLNDMHRSTSDDPPNPALNPVLNPALSNEPLHIKTTSHTSISHADWDELFHAIQVRLENCVDDAPDKATQPATDERLAAMKTTVRQCVDAMRQLHASLILERQDHQIN